ncbi:MAG: DUF6266 family protein [Bacteroidota bacterium]
MAIFKNGILGAFNGKVGTVVGYELNGVPVGRSLPSKRKGKVSANEMANRKKFAYLQAWLQPLTGFLRVGFKDYDPKFQGFVAAKSYNSKHALTGEYPDFLVEPALALVSYGSLSLAETATAVSEKPYTITINWTNGRYQSMEKAMVVLYDIDSKRALMDTAATWRVHEKFEWVLDAHHSGKKIHVYLAFIAFDQSERSNSQYLGEVTVL